MQKTVFVHIGLHKTGSTSIQNFLSANRDVWAGNGVFIPQTGCRGNHHALYDELRHSENNNLRHWEKVLEEFDRSDVSKLIISSEHFEFLKLDYVKKLKALLSAFDARILVYLRRQDLLMQAIYSQQTKYGNSVADLATFQNLILSDQQGPIGRTRLTFDHVLAPWKEAFGIGNIILRVLEKTQLKGTLCEDFLNAIGITESSQFRAVEDANRSPSYKTLQVIRFTRQIVGIKPRRFSRLYAIPIMEYARQHGWDKERCSFLTLEESLRILSAFEESNAVVAREYLRRADGKLFSEKPIEAPGTQFSIARLTEPEIDDLAKHLGSKLPDAMRRQFRDRLSEQSKSDQRPVRGQQGRVERKRTRQLHTAGFKAEVALAALKGDKTLAELTHQFGVHMGQITRWKNRLHERAQDVFAATGRADGIERRGIPCPERQPGD